MSARLIQLFAFLEATPNEPFLLFAIAKEYEGLKDDENTKLYYEKLIVEHQSYVGTYYHLGKFYERQNQILKAIEIYKKGMEVAKAAGDKHAWGELSTAKMIIDDEDEF
jgi:tetratricopeptide (TPR) repeat protein